jgi:hypothetical protein
VSSSGSPGPLPTNDTNPTGSADRTGASAWLEAARLVAADVFFVALRGGAATVSVWSVVLAVLLTVAFSVRVVGCAWFLLVLMTPAPR